MKMNLLLQSRFIYLFGNPSPPCHYAQPEHSRPSLRDNDEEEVMIRYDSAVARDKILNK